MVGMRYHNCRLWVKIIYKYNKKCRGKMIALLIARSGSLYSKIHHRYSNYNWRLNTL